MNKVRQWIGLKLVHLGYKLADDSKSFEGLANIVDDSTDIGTYGSLEPGDVGKAFDNPIRRGYDKPE